VRLLGLFDVVCGVPFGGPSIRDGDLTRGTILGTADGFGDGLGGHVGWET
jgi:hypothetical protein